ncbi:MmgE/PrpD family protein [Methylobacterium persicinum]|uniref:2-methylcitrate dehydratase PrpD n=1 Tax=Methylobacterium persicinum TaxID=374426 RepID=A0ABU0HN26_9HYPH|nr:MmgE/PrpD family protein [Methylobacterium persicinum]MDQ0443737.1 2-methylcitrate dehydratase PrpD [Methylobacterium persicinum]GJE40137.1 2-methylcitrate dehydratase 2 [Methylobacterium persicinum]
MTRNASARGPARRRLLQGAGSLLAAAALPARAAPAGAEITGRLARYMVEARDRPLPQEVTLACKHRILDTLGAMISGARMRPGEMAMAYVRGLGGVEEATIVASNLRTTAINAALANAMCAHSDETDDFEPVTKAHPGSATVPAALAMAEKEGRSGLEMIRAVALGYDLCCRLLLALGPDLVRGSHRSAEGTSSTFGALGAAAALARLDERSTRFALSYAAQQVSGLWSWVKDEDHIEKAFDFAGMGARNGVTAVTMVQAGLTGVADVLDGTHNLFIALSTDPKPEAMLDGLGSRYFVTETAIKTFSVGYPIQSPLDATLTLRERYDLRAADVQRVVVHLPTDAVGIVGHSAMPDVNCQHLVALALVKGAVSFSDSHDASLMQDPSIRAVREKVEVLGDPALMMREAPRSARVELFLADGRRLEHVTKFPPGTKENPLTTERVNAKVRDLIAPVLGAPRADALIAQVNDLENLSDVRGLRNLIAP